jgi:hypothetical protein
LIEDFGYVHILHQPLQKNALLVSSSTYCFPSGGFGLKVTDQVLFRHMGETVSVFLEALLH